MPNEFSELLPKVIDIARKAGKGIMPFFHARDFTVSHKQDKTPLTEADMLANDLIVNALSAVSDYPILSEEGEKIPFSERQNWERFWLIDPLDGTKGFIHGIDEFTVNIALIENHRPILGVLYAPAYDTLYYASRGNGAFVLKGEGPPQAIQIKQTPFDSLCFVVGKYHNSRRLKPVVDAIPHASLLRLNSSLKFVRIAEGLADVYIRLGPICEWDTGAGECILEEAGGKVVDFSGRSLQYNARKSLLWEPFIALGNVQHIDSIIELFEKEALQ